MRVHARAGDEPIRKALGDAKPGLSGGDMPRERDASAGTAASLGDRG